MDTNMNSTDHAAGNGWHRGAILRAARQFLQTGGSIARREIVKTTLELTALLQEA